jgi:hypothetical protein
MPGNCNKVVKFSIKYRMNESICSVVGIAYLIVKWINGGEYERKLEKVMERFGTKDFNYNFDRHGCWIEFRYKGQLYRFDHHVAKEKSKGATIWK